MAYMIRARSQDRDREFLEAMVDMTARLARLLAAVASPWWQEQVAAEEAEYEREGVDEDGQCTDDDE